MSDFNLRTPVVDPEILMDAASTLAESPRALTSDEIEQIIDRSPEYTESVILLGKQLNLFEEEGGSYQVIRDVRMQVRQSSEGQKTALLSGLLQQYKPFIAFTSSIIQGNPPERAALQAKILYEISMDESQVKDQFRKLGVYANILHIDDDDAIGLGANSSIITDEQTHDFADSISSPLVARLYLENRLDDDLVAYMDEDTMDELINALELFWERPRSAIASAGRAVEDFQRAIGEDRGQTNTNYSKANGITELADMLHSDGLTKSRHLHGGKFLGGMRNPSGGHGKDPETLERWDVTEEVALVYVQSAIHYIRSLYAFVIQDRQVL